MTSDAVNFLCPPFLCTNLGSFSIRFVPFSKTGLVRVGCPGHRVFFTTLYRTPAPGGAGRIICHLSHDHLSAHLSSAGGQEWPSALSSVLIKFSLVPHYWGEGGARRGGGAVDCEVRSLSSFPHTFISSKSIFWLESWNWIRPSPCIEICTWCTCI